MHLLWMLDIPSLVTQNFSAMSNGGSFARSTQLLKIPHDVRILTDKITQIYITKYIPQFVIV